MMESLNLRHSRRLSIQLSPTGGKSNRLLSLWERIEVRVSENPVKKQNLRSAQYQDFVALCANDLISWIPACAGMTGWGVL
jgi:hypothetical protein